MEIVTLPVGPLQANCYLLFGDEKTAAVVDPGGDGGRILAELRERRLSVGAVLLTHAHFDHMLAAGEVREATGAPLWVPEGDAEALADPVRSLLSWMPQESILPL
ncbi:MAG TPA: MBL fold metallo-hydrolase, partial [Firmicutes bacterium]|nr:MBL fold metallo-hydrolase [Bacillota bacterium]